jgi:nocturnin
MNTLADMCADQSEFGFPHARAEILAWNYRKNLLIEELICGAPDFICLQEVDHWTDWFEPELSRYGYVGCFRNSAEDMALTPRGHGLALLWKNDRWSLDSEVVVKQLIPSGSQIMMMVTLVSESTRIHLITCHLKAKKKFAETRLAQGVALLEIVPATDITLIGGDFNASPDEPVIKLLRQHFRSVYADCPQGYTTAKIRAELTVHTIDYLWIPQQGQIRQRLSIPPLQTLSPDYLPRVNYPSDHLALMGEISFK